MLVPLTKVKKKGKEQKSLYIKKIQAACDKYQGCYVFHYENLITKPFRDIQTEFASSKFVWVVSRVDSFWGRTK